jgi:hypothetical protein
MGKADIDDKKWNQIINKLWRGPNSNNKSNFLPDLIYRGLPNKAFKLQTSLQRLPIAERCFEGNSKSLLLNRERRLIDSFKKYAKNYLPPNADEWEIILVAQHYRLPTRLLDWTLSPLVALFFASEEIAIKNCPKCEKCNGSLEPDGIIWCVSRTKTRERLSGHLLTLLENLGTLQFDIETLRKRFPVIGELEDVDNRDNLIWFEPPTMDSRIENQFAYFSLMPGVDMDTQQWIERCADGFTKIKIKGHLKKYIRKRLYQMNITDRTIYPGLEGIAKWQKAYYCDDSQLPPPEAVT